MPEDQYDAIGGQWEDASAMAAFGLLHRAFAALVGDVRGLDVLDVATGTGVYARMWAGAGARRVVGSDRSTEMVTAARDLSTDVEYHVADAVDHPRLGTFDLVTAAFLLNYAYDADTMAAMARTLYDHVRPGGRLAGILPHPEYAFDGPDTARFGLWYTPLRAIDIGTVALVTVRLDPPITYEFVLARREVYADALTRAGFETPRWHPFHVPDPARPNALDGLAVNPPVVLYETTRPG